MSQSTPVCHMKCSKCQQRAPSEERHGRKATRSYLNVVVIGCKGASVVCQCRTCGHTYKTRSAAARRAARRMGNV